MPPITHLAVQAIFATYPAAIREKLLALRELILHTAASMNDVGEIQETLKWGEPAYLTSKSGSGSTIRLGWKPSRPSNYAMYFNCQTSLIANFKTLFPAEFNYEGNRAIVFDASEPVAVDALAVCLSAALSYHRRNKREAVTMASS